VLVLRDVTGQMDSLHFLQSLVDALPTPVYFQDQEGVFRLCNQAFLSAFGLSREQVIGRGAAEFLPGGLAEILEHFHRELRQGSGTRALETRLPLADGLPHDLLLAMTSYHGSLGQAQGVLGQAADITEARRAEERFRTLFEGAADALFIHDAQGQVLEINTEACSRLGYTREELLRLNLREIEGSAGAEALDLRLREVVQRGQALFQTVHLARDGSAIPTEVSARTMELQGRTVIFSTARDISERRQAEDERVRLEAMVQQAQKLEAIGQLAGGVAHDFGNILTAILGYCEILLKRMPPGPNLEFVRQIQAACHRASTLTQGLLAFGRRQPFSPRPLELNGWLAAMQDFFRRLLREDIELAIQTAPAPLPLQADEAQLEQVLLNLLTNARDAMPRGGRILVAAARQGDRACLSVTDQGTGLDEATRSRIFEPFFTTKERGKGTGLGLAVVWGIVQQHHGAIEVDSTPGQGTTFRVLLPLVAGAMEATPIAPGEAPPPAGRETVLLAEDDRMLRGLLSASLREAGYTVLEAADGQEALRLFSSAGLQIDAAILDIVMPQVTGDQVLQEIRARRPGLPALLMSGHVPEGAERMAAANSLLRKPFATAELLRRLREALDA
jgi:PAS domain S-box-containing protein